MKRLLFLCLLLASSLALADSTTTSTDYKLAPSEEELDARVHDYLLGRRVMAVVLVGGTFVAGLAGSVIRRRARKRQEENR
jgi:hypothetical protein